MRRKFSRNYSLSVVVPFLVILILLIAAAVLAQTSGAGQTTGKANAVLAQAAAVAPAQAERPLTPWTGAGSSPVSRSQTKRHGAGPGPPLFQPVVTYDSGGHNAWAVAVADVNGDGKPDVAVVNNENDTVGVLLGNGDGTFQPAVTYNSGGPFPDGIAIADVNGDGKPDLVVANYRNATVGVLLGNGDGTFQPAVAYGSGATYGAVSVAVADVSGDGKPDILVANNLNGTVGVLLGNGDGTFQPVITYDVSGLGPYLGSVAVADVNGDGKPDVIVVDYEYVGVLLGNGDGTFQPVVSYNAGGWGFYSAVAVADVNGDGKPDILVANEGSNNVGVLLGNGNGTFQTTVVYGSGGTQPLSVAVADVNGDGKPDLLVSEQTTSGVVGVLFGNGDGTFQPAGTYSSGGYGAWSVAVADVNGDGTPDVLVANRCTSNSCTGDGSVGVLLNIAGESGTSLTTSRSPSFVGQPVTFTATVTSGYGKIPDGELVTFYDGPTEIGTGTTAGGVATFTTSSLASGKHIINATYAGDATFKPSTGSVKQVVNKYRTTTALGSSLNPSQFGQAVTFTATVASAGPTPTGKVSFKDGRKVIGTVTMSGGVATLTTSTLAVGTHPITAKYSGDAANDKSTSPVLDQVVQ